MTGARRGWHAYRPVGRSWLPGWVEEVAFALERPVGPAAVASALLLVRAAGRGPAVARAFGTAAREVELVAGLRRPAGLELVRPNPLRGGEPVGPEAVAEHLRLAAMRGLVAPLRRRRPAGDPSAVAWQAGPGAVLTCLGPWGRSAQAVVALHGLGDPAAVVPGPGGALLLRACRVGRHWRLVAALVLGADGDAGPATVQMPAPGPGWPERPGSDPDAPGGAGLEDTSGSGAGTQGGSGAEVAAAHDGPHLEAGGRSSPDTTPAGLGRVAVRRAATLCGAGWQASVVAGAAAVALARAGDPRQAAPREGAGVMDAVEVTAWLAACLAATGMAAGLDDTAPPAPRGVGRGQPRPTRGAR